MKFQIIIILDSKKKTSSVLKQPITRSFQSNAQKKNVSNQRQQIFIYFLNRLQINYLIATLI